MGTRRFEQIEKSVTEQVTTAKGEGLVFRKSTSSNYRQVAYKE